MTGLREVWAVFAVRLLLGAARTFPMPSSQTITPNLVPAVVFGGFATIAVAGLWILLFPELAKSDRLPGGLQRR